MKIVILSLLSLILPISSGTVQSEHSNNTQSSGISLAAACNACHGTSGRSATTIPSIAGMDKNEFVRKLRQFKTGERAATVMDRIAKGYSESDFTKMAEWFAVQAESEHE